jgi:hypothetical protein
VLPPPRGEVVLLRHRPSFLPRSSARFLPSPPAADRQTLAEILLLFPLLRHGAFTTDLRRAFVAIAQAQPKAQSAAAIETLWAVTSGPCALSRPVISGLLMTSVRGDTREKMEGPRRHVARAIHLEDTWCVPTCLRGSPCSTGQQLIARAVPAGTSEATTPRKEVTFRVT